VSGFGKAWLRARTSQFQKVLDRAFVPEPPFVVRDEVLVLTPRAPHDHDAVFVRLPRKTLRRARFANAAGEHHVQVFSRVDLGGVGFRL
jgi:hypothetical protein|tara:strand:+ start:1084 stop:1350 length:267 start_codon:yes stop_codon:yes gene_type:complete